MKRTILSPKEFIFVLLGFITVFISAFAIGWNYGYQGIVPFGQQSSRQSDVKRAWNLIQSHYDGEIDIESLVASLKDPYSYYVSKTEYEKLKAEDSGQAVGIGVQYVLKEKLPVVVEVFGGSPAFISGIIAGDTIIAVDDQPLDALSNEVEIRNRIKGHEKEQSVFTIQKQDASRRDISITRAVFDIPTFVYKILDSSVAYLKIYHFSPKLPEDFEQIREKLVSDKPTRLIVDLRNNLGGQTTSATFFADQFIKNGILVKEKWKNEKSEDIVSASGIVQFPDIPVFLLVNGGTSSAAEVVTAAFQDNKRAVVVGSKTYGKGTAGIFFDLADGGAIHLTIGKWFTPNGTSIDGVGITPDIVVQRDGESENDEVLTKALTATGK